MTGQIVNRCFICNRAEVIVGRDRAGFLYCRFCKPFVVQVDGLLTAAHGVGLRHPAESDRRNVAPYGTI